MPSEVCDEITYSVPNFIGKGGPGIGAVLVTAQQ